MAGVAILKHTYDLSDEVLCERWVENPYYQFFCGEEFFQHRLVFDRSSLTRWRQRMGEGKLQALLQESLAVATKTKCGAAIKVRGSVNQAIWVGRRIAACSCVPDTPIVASPILLPSQEAGRTTGRHCERAAVALGPRPSACKANRPVIGRGQGCQPPKAVAHRASLEHGRSPVHFTPPCLRRAVEDFPVMRRSHRFVPRFARDQTTVRLFARCATI